MASLPLTDEHRSLIASAVIAGFTDRNASLCCGPYSRAACARIVGAKYAGALHTFAHENLGCSVGTSAAARLERYLDKISDLRVLEL